MNPNKILKTYSDTKLPFSPYFRLVTKEKQHIALPDKLETVSIKSIEVFKLEQQMNGAMNFIYT